MARQGHAGVRPPAHPPHTPLSWTTKTSFLSFSGNGRPNGCVHFAQNAWKGRAFACMFLWRRIFLLCEGGQAPRPPLPSCTHTHTHTCPPSCTHIWGRFFPSHWGWALATTPLHRHAQTRVNTHHATLGTEGRPFQMRGTHSAGMYDLQETAQIGRRVLQTRASRRKPRGS